MQAKQDGFTLIEAVVAAVILAITIVAISNMFAVIADLNRNSRNLALATQIAQQKIEADRNLGYNAIPASEDFTSQLPQDRFGSPKSATATFTDLSPTVPGLKRLSITIYYTEKGHRRDVQATTLIAERGINK